MRIATMTNWAYGVTVCLTLASGTAMVFAARADKAERAAIEQRGQLDHLSEVIETDVFEVTNQARLFAVNADTTHREAYAAADARLSDVEGRARALRDVGANPDELSALAQALSSAGGLQDERQAAIAAAERGEQEAARSVLFGSAYVRQLERTEALLARFQDAVDRRTEGAVNAAANASRALRTVSEVMVGVTMVLFLFVIGFILKRRILRPVVTLSDIVNRLAAQDFAVEPPLYPQVDEIGDMAQAIRVFRENGLARQRLERQRDDDWEVRGLLARMTQRLQACGSLEELAGVVALFAPQIAPALDGQLLVRDARGDLMRVAAEWPRPSGEARAFAPEACWAIRRGQLHQPGGAVVDVPCAHVPDDDALNAICVPLSAQGETIGLIAFRRREGAGRPVADLYIELMAETVAMALANLNLRDRLHRMAGSDALTGLRNRRDLDRALEAASERAAETGRPFSCVMLDIDHFKALNDTHGHQAGDLALAAIAAELRSAVREGDLVFRYGGEEFLIVLSDVSGADAADRAESIRRRVAALPILHGDRDLGPVTASLGVATYPTDGEGTGLVGSADAALLRAKRQGRNRVVSAGARSAERLSS